MNWFESKPAEPLTRESFRASVEQMMSAPIPPLKDYCGPFHPKDVDWMIENNHRCPACGLWAKDHK